MNTALAFFLVLGTLAKAEIDWSNVFPKHIKNVPHVAIRHGIPDARITGGVEAVPNSFPWQVALFIPVHEGTVFCGGSLVSRQTVLTAAHCVENIVDAVLVVLGAHRIRDIEPKQVRVNSSGILVHPQWSSFLIRNDIALVRLPKPVVLNNAIRPIALASDPTNTFVGHQARVSGWGIDSDSATTISEALREVTIPVISNSVCNTAFLGTIQDTHICASGLGGKSTCSGDSGGALVIAGIQVGIASFGLAQGCEVGWPSVYTRVTSYIDWINANLI